VAVEKISGIKNVHFPGWIAWYYKAREYENFYSVCCKLEPLIQVKIFAKVTLYFLF